MEAVQKYPDQTAWARLLPEILSILEGLGRNAVEDTNAASIAFLESLEKIEVMIVAANKSREASLNELSDMDRLSAQHEGDRVVLSKSISDAISFGSVVQGEIIASREALAAIGTSIGKMRGELVLVERIAKEIKILAVNATIESARAGDAGRGFAVIAGSVRELAIKTEEITQRLSPLVNSAHDELSGHFHDTAQGEMENSRDVVEQLSDQGTLLSDVGDKLDALAQDYVGLIEARRERIKSHQNSGQEMESTIRAALASAQSGDVIRQQIETIVQAQAKLREIASSITDDPAVADALGDLLANLSSGYVMKSQHMADAKARGTAAGSSDDGPLLEFF